MTLDRLLGKVALLSGLSLFGYNCDSASPEPTSCVKDTDCKGERICDSNTKMCVATKSTTPQEYKYIWGVGNCEHSYNKDELLSKFKEPVAFVRTFSNEEVDRSGDYINEKCFDAYQCALKKNSNLYSLKTDKGVRLVDNLFLFTNETYPGKEACFKMIESQPWYSGCFKKGSSCHEP